MLISTFGRLLLGTFILQKIVRDVLGLIKQVVILKKDVDSFLYFLFYFIFYGIRHVFGHEGSRKKINSFFLLLMMFVFKNIVFGSHHSVRNIFLKLRIYIH